MAHFFGGETSLPQAEGRPAQHWGKGRHLAVYPRISEDFFEPGHDKFNEQSGQLMQTKDLSLSLSLFLSIVISESLDEFSPLRI